MRAAVFVALLLCACSGYDPLPLLEVSRIEPPEIESGGTLRIHGRGFPLGHSPDIVLRGSVYRPGVPPSALDLRLVGHVQSESLIEIPIGDELIDAVGGRATVDGELRVSFRAADDRRDVFSSERVRIDFLPDTSIQLRAASARREPADPGVARSFGLELCREELGTVGVRVVSVEPDGLAAAQGVRPGDTLVGLDGISLYSWRDFIPDPRRNESTVLAVRDGLRGVHALRWPHEATEQVVDPIAIALFVSLGLVLGWMSPLLTSYARTSTLSLSAWLTRASLLMTFAALLVLIPEIQWTTMWILGLGTFAALLTLAIGHRVGVSSFVLAVAGSLTVMVLSRTASIPAIVEAQSTPGSGWYLLQSPASFLALGGYLYALGAVRSAGAFPASLYAAAAAVLGATLFLGGSSLTASAAGIASLAVKAAALLILAQGFELPRNTAAICSGLGLGLALLGLVVDFGGLFPLWSAVAIGWLCAVSLRALLPPLRRESAPAIA